MTLNIKNSIDNIGKKIITFPNNFHFSCSTHDSSNIGKDGGNNSKNTVTKEELEKKHEEFKKKIKEMDNNVKEYHEQETIKKKGKDLMEAFKDKSNFKANPMEFVDELHKILLSKEAILAEKQNDLWNDIKTFVSNFIHDFRDGEPAPDLKEVLDYFASKHAGSDEEKNILRDSFKVKRKKTSLWWIVYVVIGVVIGFLGWYGYQRFGV
jgi:hypothetical protein